MVVVDIVVNGCLARYRFFASWSLRVIACCAFVDKQVVQFLFEMQEFIEIFDAITLVWNGK